MLSGFHTAKTARFTGRGDSLARALIGEHAPRKSPFYTAPAFPQAAMLLDPAWFYYDLSFGFDINDWTNTEVGAGGSVAYTTDRALLLTCDAADNDLQQLQHLKTFTPAADRFAGCYWREQVSDATQSDVYGGWSSADTSIVASEPADFAMTKKDDGDTIVNGRSNDAGGTGSETANLITTYTAATDYDFGVVLKCTSGTAGTMFFCYKLASATAWSQVTKTSDFPDAAVRFTQLIQNGEAVAKTKTIKKLAFWMWEG